MIPEDVQQIFTDVCAHRIILNPKARVSELSADDILRQVMKQIKSPDSGQVTGGDYEKVQSIMGTVVD